MAKNNYFKGEVFSARWITESIKDGKLLDKENYFKYENLGEGLKRIEFGKGKVPYTITEGIKLLEIGISNKNSRYSN